MTGRQVLGRIIIGLTLLIVLVWMVFWLEWA